MVAIEMLKTNDERQKRHSGSLNHAKVIVLSVIQGSLVAQEKPKPRPEP